MDNNIVSKKFIKSIQDKVADILKIRGSDLGTKYEINIDLTVLPNGLDDVEIVVYLHWPLGDTQYIGYNDLNKPLAQIQTEYDTKIAIEREVAAEKKKKKEVAEKERATRYLVVEKQEYLRLKEKFEKQN